MAFLWKVKSGESLLRNILNYFFEKIVPSHMLEAENQNRFYVARVNAAINVALALILIPTGIIEILFEFPLYRAYFAAAVVGLCFVSLGLLSFFRETILKYVGKLAVAQIVFYLLVIFSITLLSGSSHNSALLWLAAIPITLSYFTKPLWMSLTTFSSLLVYSVLLLTLDYSANVAPHKELFVIDLVGVILYSYFLSLAFNLTQSHVDAVMREKEEKMAKEQRKLVMDSKFSALGKMTANLAHEINNPLFSLQGDIYAFRQGLERGELDREQGIEFVDLLDKRILNISKIIRAVSAFAREGVSLERRVEKLDILFEESLGFCLDRLKDEEIRFHYHFDPTIYVSCNGTQIMQVFLNLLNNAMDAMKNSDDRELVVRGKKVGQFAEISVCDTGPGVPKEVEKEIFEPFYTTKEGSHGMGLGLSISRAFIDEHGGELSLQSRQGKTCFLIRLPLTIKKEEEL